MSNKSNDLYSTPSMLPKNAYSYSEGLPVIKKEAYKKDDVFVEEYQLIIVKDVKWEGCEVPLTTSFRSRNDCQQTNSTHLPRRRLQLFTRNFT